MAFLRDFFKARGDWDKGILSPSSYLWLLRRFLVDCSWKLGMMVLFWGSRLGEEGGGGEEISHLLFVDDTSVCEASKEQVTFLYWLLMWFETMLALKINLEKREIILVGEVDSLEDLACEIGCKVGKLSSSCLGLPLGVSYKSMVVWDGVKERFRKRLSLWKRQHLSNGRRLTLLRSTLASL